MVIGLIVGLYALGAALPLWGLAGLFFEARAIVRRLSRGQDPRSVDTGQWPVSDTFRVWREETLRRPAKIRTDLGLIGGGVVCSTAASVWSLFV